MASQQSDEYLLGTNQSELERLRFQHFVWSGIADAFLDRLDIQQGWDCLDVSAVAGAEWMHSFFSAHVPLMTQKGLCSASEVEAILRD